MNHAKRISTVFSLLGVVLLLAAAALSFLSLNAPARLLSDGEKAEAQTQALMDALCAGDHAAASKLMAGAPTLGVDRDPETDLGVLFWDAYSSSLSYEFSGPCYAGESGLCRDVTITALDIPAALEVLRGRLPELLSRHVAATEPDLVYNEDGTYRDAFIMEVVSREAGAILDSEAQYTGRTITLHLTSQGGKWLVQPEQALMNVLAGGMGA